MTPRLTFATILTALRILVTPFAVYAIVHQLWHKALVWTVCAVATDLIDGPCARWWNQVSKFGEMLDAIADKIFMLSMFTALLYTFSALSYLSILILIMKDFILVVGGSYLYFVLEKPLPRPNIWGKITIGLQLLLFLLVVITGTMDYVPLQKAVFIIECAAVVSSLVTVIAYILQSKVFFIKKGIAS